MTYNAKKRGRISSGVKQCSQTSHTADFLVSARGEAFEAAIKQVDDPVPETRDGPTIERMRQAHAAAGSDAVSRFASEEGLSATRLLDGDVLELLLKRKVISSEQYAAGQEFHRHWYKSGLAASGVVDLARPRVDGGKMEQQSDAALHHLGKWQEMVRLLGQLHSQVLIDCVLLGQTLAEYGSKRGTQSDPKRAGIWAQGRLTAALEQLVISMQGERRPRIVSGMTEDARPSIAPWAAE